jgi:hypothetical protein
VSAERDVNRIVRSWMDEGATALPDRVLDAVLDQIPATPQRRATWWRVQRYVEMNKFVAIGLATAAAIVVLALIGLNLIPGAGPGPGGEPSVAPSAATTPAAFSNTTALPPGPVVIDGAFPLTIVFDLPEGWVKRDNGAALASVTVSADDMSPEWVEWFIVDNAFADPCHSAGGPLDPAVGPSVDDLVTALTNMVGVPAGPVTEITIDGYSGKSFELTTELDADVCDSPNAPWLDLWTFGGGEVHRALENASMRIWVLDVDGTRLVVVEDAAAEATSAERFQGQRIVESMRFE